MTTATLRLSTPLPEAPDRTAQRACSARFYDALIEARMRQAMREIAMHRHLVPRRHAEDAGYRRRWQRRQLPFTR